MLLTWQWYKNIANKVAGTNPTQPSVFHTSRCVLSWRQSGETVLPCADTVPMLLWALLASGQIQMRKVDGWETLSQPIEPITLDLAA